MTIRLMFLECMASAVGVETWKLIVQSIKRLKWLYRRIFKIPWTDRVTNEEVLRKIGQGTKLMTYFAMTNTLS